MTEITPQDTASALGFDCSDDELRRFMRESEKVFQGTKTMSEAIRTLMKEFDVPLTDESKRAAGLSFIFTYGIARVIAKAELKAEEGLK